MVRAVKISSKKKNSGQLHIIPAVFGVSIGVMCIFFLYAFFSDAFGISYYSADDGIMRGNQISVLPKLDTADYDRRMQVLALATTTLPKPAPVATTTATGTVATTEAAAPLWPANAVYPNAGALLPFNRIVAYYGNFYSRGMGVIGEYSEEEVLRKLKAEVAVWEAADPTTPVVPAIEYIDVTAQESAGSGGLYSLRMPDSQIDIALKMAKKINGIVILDIQLGLSSLEKELPLLDTYWKMPNVHLALDPEFAMHTGAKPGTVIGSMDAVDINYAAQYLAKIVRDYNLPPKILVVHRFTRPMVTNYKQIKPLPEVQIIMDMDGWGPPEKKIGTYNAFLNPEPVQFTGVKLFYKNDLKPPSTRLLTPAEILKLIPRPIFIQYQ